MFHALLVAAAALPLLVTEAKVTPTDDGLSVVISTGLPIPTDGVRAGMGAHGLEVSVPNLALGQASLVLGNATMPLFAQERAGGSVEFVIPVPGRLCAGPIPVASIPEGLRLTAKCAGLVMEHAKAAVAEPKVEAKPEPKAEPVSEPMAKSTLEKSSAAIASTLSPKPIDDSTLWRGLAPLLLVAVVGGLIALFLRKRAGPSRLIQVIETASLGPKRNIVVARVGQETLILGTSEAGIHLLGSRPGASEAYEPGALPGADPREAARQAVAQVATSLFNRQQAGPRAVPKPSFDDVLSETHEDQELRRKLAAGLAGRVA